MLAAGRQQHEALQGSERADHVLIAASRYLAGAFPPGRDRQQTARIALRLHRGDALYEEEAA